MRDDVDIAAVMREARATALGVWLADHQDQCGCGQPDSTFCDLPVPFECTESELREVLRP